MYFVSILFLSLVTSALSAQDKNADTNEEQEVYLAFRYRGIINNVVTSYYKDDKFYLPVVELFNLLQIEANTKFNGYVKIHGEYGDTNQKYEIDLSSGYIKIGSNRINLMPSDYLMKEIDFYLTPEIYEEVFELIFLVDFNNLTLELETNLTLPVVARYDRQKLRERIQNQSNLPKEKYDLAFDRNRHFFNGGFLDYTLSSNITNSTNVYTYNGNLGAEILGGDVQGAILGSYSNSTNNFTTNNLRYRYVTQDLSWLQEVSVGQLNTMGLSNNLITGIQITNQPVRPRLLFDQYLVEGTTLPQSEVELYLNNALVDFKEADALGNYRFNVPLTYGNSRLDLQIFGPNGQIRDISRRIQVPFTFLPPGETNYTVNAGKLQNPLLGTTDDIYTIQSQVSSGLTNWLTGSVGAEYYEEFNNSVPIVYGSLSSRIKSQYLVNIDVAPDAFYRASANAVYPSSAGWSVDYTFFNQQQNIFNRVGAKQELFTNLFFPFRFGDDALFNFRLSGSRQFRSSRDLTRYQINLNSRIKKLNVRLGYRDTQTGPLELRGTNVGRLSSSLTYTLSRTPGIPFYLRGVFLRLQTDYNPVLKELENAQFVYSRNLFNTGRIQLSMARNFQADFNTIGLNFTIDFNKVRTNTTFRSIRDDYSLTNTFRGSIGYDNHNNAIVTTNRQQVGRAGASVRMFVDKNNSGDYDSGDEIIRENAVRLSQSGSTFMNEETGLTYITQLRPYDRYNLEVNKSAIKNPLLVPKIDQFSFVTDPNTYKPIEIPFYISGIIDGMVERVVNDSTKVPVAGLKLYLSQKNGNFTREIRTFSDGSFYAYEVPPGEYQLSADSTQLEILGTVSTDKSKTFNVNALAQGDFITGLNFLLKSKSLPETQITQNDSKSTESTLFDLFNKASTSYELQLETFENEEEAKIAARQAQLLFNESFRLNFNSKTEHYSLRSYSIGNRQTAISKLLNIQKSQFQNAVLVVTYQNGLDAATPNPETKPVTAYYVQLGAFSLMGNAINFTEKIQPELELGININYDESIGLYKVQTQPIADKSIVMAALSRIKSSTLISDAFLKKQTKMVPLPAPVEQISLNYTYNVLIEGVTPQTEQAYLSAVTANTDVDINESPKKDLLIFENIKSWQEVLKLKEKLSQISTIAQPIIVLIEKK